MNSYFLDSGYLIALESKNDQYHNESQIHWKSIFKSPSIISTSSYVFDEVVTYFNTRGYHSKAIEIGEILLQSSFINFIHIDQEIFDKSWNFFNKHSDKTYSFTDCISFILMDKLDIQTALTFDHHFNQAGFKVMPS